MKHILTLVPPKYPQIVAQQWATLLGAVVGKKKLQGLALLPKESLPLSKYIILCVCYAGKQYSATNFTSINT